MRRGPRPAVALPAAAVLVVLVVFGILGGRLALGGPLARAAANPAPLSVDSSGTPSGYPTPHPLSAPAGASAKPAVKAVPVLKRAPTPRFVSTLRLGARGPIVSDVQQRLVWTGVALKVTGRYDARTVTAVRTFQSKQSYQRTGRVDRRTYARLVAVTKRGADLDPRCVGDAAVLCIDKSQKVLRYLVGGTLAMLVDVRFGSAELPTREGQFSVYYKARYHVSNLFHTPMPFAMFFSGGQAVHYSRFFAAVGYNGHSHGCVNVRDLGAIQALFDQVEVGTRVVIYRTAA